MATTLTAMPVAIVAGDSLNLVLNDSNHPASSWVITYTFRKKDGSPITFSSTADGDSHVFALTSSDTIGWIAGTYKGDARASDGADANETIWSGWLTVLPDLANQSDNFDARTHAQKCLDAIDSVLEGKASRDAIATTIAGQSITRMSFDELLRAKAYYEAIVYQEQVDAGQKGNQVLVRFSAP